MKPKVYIETTVVSYLTARPTRDLVLSARQRLTQEWWDERRDDFGLYISALVVREASKGDREAASRRLAAIAGLPTLQVKDEATRLAHQLLRDKAVPQQYPEDALHIALAAAHGMDYLMTWNFAHIANAIIRGRIEAVVVAAGLNCPVICTPEELFAR